jgi:Papain-like cysteine protease AvrRpt2
MLRRIQKCLLLALCAASLLVAAEPAGLWLDVPFVKQEKDGCGAASIAMVMQYWRRQQPKSAGEDSDVGRIQQALTRNRRTEFMRPMLQPTSTSTASGPSRSRVSGTIYCNI